MGRPTKSNESDYTRTRMESHGFADRLGLGRKRDFGMNSNRVFPLIRGGRKAGGSGGITLGLPSQRWLLFVGDILLIMLASSLSAWIRSGALPYSLPSFVRALILVLTIYPTVLYIFDLYNVERSYRSLEIAFRGGLAAFLSGMFSMFVFYLVLEGNYGRTTMAVQMVLIWGFVCGWRWLYARMFHATVKKTPVLILGAGRCGKVMANLLDSPFSMYVVRGFVDDDPTKQGQKMSPMVIGTCIDLMDITKNTGAETAILAIPRNRSPRLIRQILEAKLHGIEVREMADVYEQLTGRIPINFIGDQWLLFAEGFYLLNKDYIQKLKRLMDLFIAGVLIVLTAPLLGLISLAIRLESPGPILYRQQRIGKREEPFTIFKFRSMRQDAESEGFKWAEVRDPRATKIGRWLRLTHMDELPQLLNIFRGDMSIVGPRPERPEFVHMLQEKIPYYFVRHSVTPGVTGWAQVNYRYGASTEDASRKLEYDLYYVKNMSLFLDFKILLRTIGVVLLGDGAR
jgi:sugar transferase (PEP-CTERM system associated)